MGDKHQAELSCAQHVWPKGSLVADGSSCGGNQGENSFKTELLEGEKA